MGKRERLDVLLVKRGLVDAREEGRRLILSGGVLVKDQVVSKVGALVDTAASIRLRNSPAPYVSRGGVKLEGALDYFGIDVRGKNALDVGASTGGFTHCLLKRQARRVVAVDVGYGQLDWRLRGDPRVVVMERRNVRYLTPQDLKETPEFAAIDLSFISLRLALAHVTTLLAPVGEVVALIKPQFEVGKGRVGKGGIVRSPAEHRRVVDEIRDAAQAGGLEVVGVVESSLLGSKGNKEFFIYCRKTKSPIDGVVLDRDSDELTELPLSGTPKLTQKPSSSLT